MKQKQTSTRAWLLSIAAFATLSLAACGGGREEGIRGQVPEPSDTTQEDRERGWKLVSAKAKGATRYNVASRGVDNVGALDGIIALASLGNRAPVYLEVYLYKPVKTTVSCQVYYNGTQEKKVGNEIGERTTIPNKKMNKAGLLTHKIKGPKKKKLPAMRVACGQVNQKDLPKVLPLEAPGNLMAVEVADFKS